MPKPDSIPAGTNLEAWSNDPWTNGAQIFPVKIFHDPGENHDNLLPVEMLSEPKIRIRMR